MVSHIELGVFCSGKTLQEIEQSLETAARAEWKYVQICLYDDASPDDWSRAIDRAHLLGLQVAALGAYSMLADPDRPRFFDCSIANAHAAIEVLDRLPLENRKVIVWGGTFDPDLLKGHPENRTIKTWDRAVEVAADLVHRLTPVQGKLLIEPYYTHILGEERDYVLFFRDVARSVGRDEEQLQIVLDPPNFVDEKGYERLGDLIDEVIARMAPITGLIHLKDIEWIKKDGSTQLLLPEPGGGAIDYARMMRSLQSHVKGHIVAIAEHFDETDVQAHRRVRAFLDQHLSTLP